MKTRVHRYATFTKRLPSLAFTRIDLVALIAICGVVIPLLSHASAKSEEDIRRAVCRNNLKQIGNWLTLYAKDNNDNLPQQVGLSGHGWAWDCSRSVLDSASSYGVPISAVYCPSAGAEYPLSDYFFSESFAQIRYSLLIKNARRIVETNVNAKIFPEPIRIRHTTFFLPRASERELTTDIVISTTRKVETSQFSGIYGGSPVPFRTSHLTEEVPDGGNILFLDGSVNWREFNDGMTPRTDAGPYFWW